MMLTLLTETKLTAKQLLKGFKGGEKTIIMSSVDDETISTIPFCKFHNSYQKPNNIKQVKSPTKAKFWSKHLITFR